MCEFLEKFQADPTSSGINYEPIRRARDKKLRSVRIGQYYRAVVRRPQSQLRDRPMNDPRSDGFRIAVTPDFLQAFMRLHRTQQRRVIDFVEKFQRDPTSSAINYEPVQRARDKKLRSVRIDQSCRAIVLHPERGNVYRLVWVDSHDDAYAWARARVFHESENGRSCHIVVEDIAEFERCIEGVPRPQQARDLFAEFDDDALSSIGVPSELVALVRRIPTVEAIRSLPGLAEHVRIALEWLAMGEPLGQVRALVVTEERRSEAESVNLIGSSEPAPDVGRIEPVSAAHGLRELLDRLMANSGSQDDDPQERRPSDEEAQSSDTPTSIPVGQGGHGDGGSAPVSGDDGRIEDRIERYRVSLLDHIQHRFGGLEPVRLSGEAEEVVPDKFNLMASRQSKADPPKRIRGRRRLCSRTS